MEDEYLKTIKIRCYNSKKDLVNNLSKTVSEHFFGILNLTYEAWEAPSGAIQEYVVLHYLGGAIKARTVNMDSEGIIVEEIGKLLTNGYYDEVDEYNKFKEMVTSPDTKWHQLA